MNFKLSWQTPSGFLVMGGVSIFGMMNGVEPLFLFSSTFLIISVNIYLLQSMILFSLVLGAFLIILF
jgi:hypothetical protein